MKPAKGLEYIFAVLASLLISGPGIHGVTACSQTRVDYGLTEGAV
jgi:hypothetical protein